jgi:hypothetical protein
MWDYFGEGLAVPHSIKIISRNHAFLLLHHPPLKKFSLGIEQNFAYTEVI